MKGKGVVIFWGVKSEVVIFQGVFCNVWGNMFKTLF